MENNLTVIIRSSGERTFSYCKKLLIQQVPEEHIAVVEEAPFSVALKKSLQIGIEKGRKWTLCIDADVLVKNNVISLLLELAENTDDKIFEIQGLVLDKFFPIMRPAGNHLYRTALMEEAIKYIPEEGTSLRPETDMLQAMSSNGHLWKQIDLIVGIHDFRQNYSDIYKKSFLQAHKHKDFISFAESYWDSKKDEDNDFRVALLGTRSGKIYNNDVFVDRNFLDSETNDVLALMQIVEKKPITEEELLVSFVDKMLENLRDKENLHEELQEKMFSCRFWNKTSRIGGKKSAISEIVNSVSVGFESTSLFRISPWLLGKLLQKIGRNLCLWSELKKKKPNRLEES